jgi:ABC-type metal ion transport system substrate-binding protein
MRKKLLGITAAITFAIGLVGCGSSDTASVTTEAVVEKAEAETEEETEAQSSEEVLPEKETAEETDLLAATKGDSSEAVSFTYTGDPVTIKVGANITPHSEILEVAKPILAEQGITLEIVQLEDSVTPNTGVIEGSLDANYFQHVPYLEQFNEENGSDLVSIGAVHYEPFGIYAGQTTDLSLLVAMKDFSLKQFIVENTLFGNTKGGLFECAVADSLYKSGYSLYYYKNDTSKKELDFLIQKDGVVIPIEVESGNSRATSLTSVIKNKQNISFGYKFIDGNIGVSDNGIITLPLYMAAFI